MPPVLSIPLNAKVEEFEKQMDRGREAATRAARSITEQFIKSNREILAGTTALTGAIAREHVLASTKVIAAWAASRVAILVGAKLLADAMMSVLNTVRDQIQEIVKISDLAQKSMSGTDFAQAFLSEARKMKVSVGDLSEALQHSFDALKEKMDSTWQVTDDVPKKLDKVLEKMKGLRELFTTDQKFTGVQLFEDATTFDAKRIAVLTFMTELEAIGERLKALDLAEEVFGSKFVDRIRSGQTSAQSMLESLQNAPRFAAQLVAETKAVDDQLRIASDRLDRSMAPQFDSLVKAVNEMKSTFAVIVELTAKAVDNLTPIANFVVPALLRAIPGLNAATAALSAAQIVQSLSGAGAGAGAGTGKTTSPLGLPAQFTPPPGGVPLPRRRPDDAPKAKEEKEAAEAKDAFEQATDAINKHIAALIADAAAVGLTHAEHERLRVELRLLEAAKQSDIKITDDQMQAYATLRARGIEPLVALQTVGVKLTDEQAKSFGDLSTRMGQVVAAADKTKTAFQGLQDSVKFAGNELINVIDRATQKGATFGDIMKDVLRSISRELLRAAILGEGAFAKILGLSSAIPGGTGGLGGVLAGLLGSIGGTGGGVLPGGAPIGQGGIGHAAGGGYVPPGGLSYVGEHGPNPRLIRAGSQGIFVTPNEPMGGGSGGGFNNFTKIELNAQGADAAAVRRLESLVAGLNASIEDRSRAAFMDDRRRRMKT